MTVQDNPETVSGQPSFSDREIPARLLTADELSMIVKLGGPIIDNLAAETDPLGERFDLPSAIMGLWLGAQMAEHIIRNRVRLQRMEHNNDNS